MSRSMAGRYVWSGTLFNGRSLRERPPGLKGRPRPNLDLPRRPYQPRHFPSLRAARIISSAILALFHSQNGRGSVADPILCETRNNQLKLLDVANRAVPELRNIPMNAENLSNQPWVDARTMF